MVAAVARPVRNYTPILREYINLAADKTAADISRPEAGSYEAALNAELEASAAGILPPDVSFDFDSICSLQMWSLNQII